MISQIYPAEHQLIKVSSFDIEAPFSDLNMSINYGIVSSRIYDKRDDFNFEVFNFPLLDGDVPRPPSYDVSISQRIYFAKVGSTVSDFNKSVGKLSFPDQFKQILKHNRVPYSMDIM